MTEHKPQRRYTLVKYSRDGNKKWPVGKGWLTKTGKGIVCEIFPGQDLRGKFYVFPEAENSQDKKDS